MKMNTRRLAAVAVLTTTLVLTGAGAALAVSDGSYSYTKQHCSGHADNYTREDETEEGCHSATASVSDGNDNEWFNIGWQQTPEGEFIDPFSPEVATDPAAGDPTTGARLYFGADDNLDGGEHDSSPQVNNGPSDGGGIQFNIDPASVALWANALAAGDMAYLLTHPVPLIDAGFGACADGVCAAFTSQRRIAYKGKAKDGSERDVADYEGKQWDPRTCTGPSDQKEDCGGHTMTWWQRREGTTYVEPGVQVYEDPDAQGSPEVFSFVGADEVLGPDPYPIPAAYAGTCGVILGGGPVTGPADTPVTNGAGQLDIATGC
jgi:hypothetical protein